MNTDGHGWKPDTADDALERRLSRVPLSGAPAELRTQVLAAAAGAEGVGGSAREPHRPGARNFQSAVRVAGQPAHGSGTWLNWLFLRFPLAGGGLAACWLAIWLGGSVDRWANGAGAAQPVIVSPEQVAEARAQRAELFQLAGFDGPAGKVQRPAADQPRMEAPAAPSGPRSDRRRRSDDGFGRLPETNFQPVVSTATPAAERSWWPA